MAQWEGLSFSWPFERSGFGDNDGMKDCRSASRVTQLLDAKRLINGQDVCKGLGPSQSSHLEEWLTWRRCYGTFPQTQANYRLADTSILGRQSVAMSLPREMSCHMHSWASVIQWNRAIAMFPGYWGMGYCVIMLLDDRSPGSENLGIGTLVSSIPNAHQVIGSVLIQEQSTNQRKTRYVIFYRIRRLGRIPMFPYLRQGEHVASIFCRQKFSLYD